MRKELVDSISALKRGETDPRRASLEPFSDLAQDEVTMMRREWVKLPLETRRRLIERMGEAAEADVANDFTMTFRVALSDPDEHIRSEAIDGLWEDEDPKLADVLVALLAQDASPDVRESAAVALEHFAMLAELEELPEATATRVRQGLLATVANEAEAHTVRHRALEAVACMSGNDVTREIEHAYDSEEEGALVAALYAMGQSGDEQWAPRIIRQLRSSDAAVRYEAVRAAGELELEEAVEPLLRMIIDPDPEVKQAVLEALGAIGGSQAHVVLEELSQTGDDITRQAAGAALAELHFREDPMSSVPLIFDEDDLEDLDEDLDEEED